MNTDFKIIFLAGSILMCASAQDPVKTDGDKYRTILENEKVRVLEYRDKPGEATHRHHHPDFILYALEPFRRRLTFPNGKYVERDFKKGDVVWMNDQIHVGENIGKTETHALIVELKPANGEKKDTVKVPAPDKIWEMK